MAKQLVPRHRKDPKLDVIEGTDIVIKSNASESSSKVVISYLAK